MTKSVHYLVRIPSDLGRVYFPIELEDANYQAYGSFFTMGREKNDVDEEYLFDAVLGDDLIETVLRRSVRRRASYEVNVNGIGKFSFNATQIGVSSSYRGAGSISDGNLVTRQLLTVNNTELNAAAREHNFYFVGKSFP